MVDGVIPKPDHDKQLYVFSGTQYATVKIESDTSRDPVSGPYKIRHYWRTFKEADWGAADAVIQVPGVPNSFYVFLGGHYFRGHINDKGDDSMQYSGVKTIESEWKPIVDAGFDTVDAGIPDPSNDDILFFFRGTKCLKYSYSGSNVVAGPKPITSYWPGIGKAGFDSIDAIFKSPNGNDYYVFRGAKYCRISWDGGWDTLTHGPEDIDDHWPFLKSWI